VAVATHAGAGKQAWSVSFHFSIIKKKNLNQIAAVTSGGNESGQFWVYHFSKKKKAKGSHTCGLNMPPPLVHNNFTDAIQYIWQNQNVSKTELLQPYKINKETYMTVKKGAKKPKYKCKEIKKEWNLVAIAKFHALH